MATQRGPGLSFANIPHWGHGPAQREAQSADPCVPEDVCKAKPRSPRWDGYLETLADHSQQPTGSPSMSTLPPSKS